MILEHYLIDSGTFRVCLHQALFRCFIYEKRDVTYAADTGQRYILVAHAHRTLENKQHGFSMLQCARVLQHNTAALIWTSLLCSEQNSGIQSDKFLCDQV